MVEEQTLIVNGIPHIVAGDPGRPLLTALRDELCLTGAKYGCGEAQCGACVVLVARRAAPACKTAVAEVAGRDITTIEGLEQGGELHPVQQAFLDADSLQCGYCTPGMILGVVDLLDRIPNPTDPEIAQALDKHLCRCGTYRRIIKAVHLAAERMQVRPPADRGDTR